jgi:hypothetical protein
MSSGTPTPIPTEILATPIAGRNLRAATFGEELGTDATVLAFLRHLG